MVMSLSPTIVSSIFLTRPLRAVIALFPDATVCRSRQTRLRRVHHGDLLSAAGCVVASVRRRPGARDHPGVAAARRKAGGMADRNRTQQAAACGLARPPQAGIHP